MKEPLGTKLEVSQPVTPTKARGWRGKLNDEQVRRAKAKAKRHELPDGHGLAVVIHPTELLRV